MKGQHSDRWKKPDLLIEAWRNVFVATTRQRVMLGLFVLGAVLLSLIRAMELAHLETRVTELIQTGHNILTVQALEPGTLASIERDSCEALSTLEEVQAAGAAEEMPQQAYENLGSAVPTFAVSVSLIPQLAQVDAVIGPAISDHQIGQIVHLAHSGQTLEAVIGRQLPNGLPFNSAVVVAYDPAIQMVDSCTVILHPAVDAPSIHAMLIAQLETAGEPLTAVHFTHQSSAPYSDFTSRVTRHAPTLVGVVFGLLFGLSATFRGSEIAAYRFSGTSRLSIVRILVYEAVVLGAIYWVSGVSSGLIVMSQYSAAFQTVMFLDHLTVVMSFTVVATLGVIFVSRRPVLDQAKDR